MQNSPVPVQRVFVQPAPPHRRRWPRRVLLLAVLVYGVYGVWRVFPRFDARLIRTWAQSSQGGALTTRSFFARGFGRVGNGPNSRTFRWWTCGNKLLIHTDRGDKGANIREAFEYAVRTLLFLAPQPDVSEFTINRLDAYGAQLIQRPEISDGGVQQSLELRPWPQRG
jgi:hypothetical protein